MGNRIFAIFVLLASLILSVSASAEEKVKPWSVDVAVGNEWLGGQRPTGGLSVTIGGRYDWPVGDKFRFHAGLTAEAFGFRSGTYWMALIAGPTAGVSYSTPVEWLELSASLSIPYGRTTMCTDWAYCMRFWGVYPGGELKAHVSGKTVGAAFAVTGRYADTLISPGLGIGFTGGGFIRW